MPGVDQNNAERAKHAGIERQNSSRCAGIYAEICEYITSPFVPSSLSIARNHGFFLGFPKIRERYIQTARHADDKRASLRATSFIRAFELSSDATCHAIFV
jgi:hypothetical protein